MADWPEPDDDPEEWRAVVGFEGVYEVSSLGRLKSLGRYRDGRFRNDGTKALFWQTEKLLKPSAVSGYPWCHLAHPNGELHYTGHVHRLVCWAFHGPPPPDKMQVAHWDGSRNNNRANNLRWASAKENAADRSRHGRCARGLDSKASRLWPEAIEFIRKHPEIPLKDLVVLFGVAPSTIDRIRKHKTWSYRL